jgi:uncharacterized protein YcbK (DUF882 family)
MDATQLQHRLDAAGVRHFTAREFLRLRRTHEIADLPDEYAGAAVRVLRMADRLREAYGAPVVCGNGYRPPGYNRLVGGARNSAHLRGAAVDLDPTDGRRAEFQQLAARLWLDEPDALAGLGVYSGGRIHLDVPHDGGSGRRFWGGTPGKWRARRVLAKARRIPPRQS